MFRFLTFVKKLKGLDWKNLVYPATSGAFLLLVIGLSLLNLRFLSKNFTKAFSTDETAVKSQLARVQFDNLLVVTKKLGIELVAEEPLEKPAPQEIQKPLIEPPPPPESAAEDKTLLKIQVLNSTETTGLAGSLKEELVQAGFLVDNTGNFSTIQELTQVKIKEGKAASFPVSVDELKQIVAEKYTLEEETQNLEPDSPYDIIIIIGE